MSLRKQTIPLEDLFGLEWDEACSFKFMSALASLLMDDHEQELSCFSAPKPSMASLENFLARLGVEIFANMLFPIQTKQTRLLPCFIRSGLYSSRQVNISKHKQFCTKKVPYLIFNDLPRWDADGVTFIVEFWHLNVIFKDCTCLLPITSHILYFSKPKKW